jgi:hypothetical protein
MRVSSLTISLIDPDGFIAAVEGKQARPGVACRAG